MNLLEEHAGLFIGLAIAAAGVLLRLFPQLASGYGFPPEKRQGPTWRLQSRHLCFGFLGVGLLTATLGLVVHPAQTAYALCVGAAFVGVLLVVGTVPRNREEKQ